MYIAEGSGADVVIATAPRRGNRPALVVMEDPENEAIDKSEPESDEARTSIGTSGTHVVRKAQRRPARRVPATRDVDAIHDSHDGRRANRTDL